MVEIGNGNGRAGLSAGLVQKIAAAVLFGLVAWNFGSVQGLEVEEGKHKQEIQYLLNKIKDIEAEQKGFESETRARDTNIFDRITDIRVQLGAGKEGKK